jgi:hypothetical protein
VSKQFLNNAAILATLHELNEHIAQPLWLFGGVGVDFLVGRWTRPHGDIDLNTLAEFRADLTCELRQLGYHSSDSGWLTHWYQQGSDRFIELVFLERDENGSLLLRIRPDDPVGIPGKYPLLSDHLDPNRFPELEGVRFRVSSPAGEWLARAYGLDVVGARQQEPKLEHDLRLLETLIAPEQIIQLRAMAKKQPERTP